MRFQSGKFHRSNDTETWRAARAWDVLLLGALLGGAGGRLSAGRCTLTIDVTLQGWRWREVRENWRQRHPWKSRIIYIEERLTYLVAASHCRFRTKRMCLSIGRYLSLPHTLVIALPCLWPHTPAPDLPCWYLGSWRFFEWVMRGQKTTGELLCRTMSLSPLFPPLLPRLLPSRRVHQSVGGVPRRDKAVAVCHGLPYCRGCVPSAQILSWGLKQCLRGTS